MPDFYFSSKRNGFKTFYKDIIIGLIY